MVPINPVNDTLRKRMVMWVLIACCMCVSGSIAHASDKIINTILKVKAAYVLNFVKFSQWPNLSFSTSSSPLVIACICEPEIAAGLSQLLGDKRANGRKLVVTHIDTAMGTGPTDDYSQSNLERLKYELTQIHAVFISDSMRVNAKMLIQNALPLNVLSIGDHKTFAESGAMLALSQYQNRVVFYANLQAIDGSDVRISSKVLRLAQLVNQK